MSSRTFPFEPFNYTDQKALPFIITLPPSQAEPWWVVAIPYIDISKPIERTSPPEVKEEKHRHLLFYTFPVLN